ncbi:MAG: hypothetical protein IKS85_09555 [Lachnospiraceae bacterium]|nr:hypothetical protein [Lachnospiraceae bacterium]
MKPMELFQNYMGTGLLLIWYLAVVIYLFLREKERDKRILFVYAPAIVLILFFNPVFFKLFQKVLGEEIYYRLIWLLPVTVTLSYGIVKICQELDAKKRVFFGCLCVVLTVTCGTLVYSSPIFTRSENLEHVPTEVAQICDEIVLPGREVIAAFPVEMVHFVRQYSPWVCMPYGREVLTGGFSELEYALRYRQVDVEKMTALAKAAGCHYVIISEEKELLGSMEEHDYELIMTAGKYRVYRDNTMNFSTVMN